MEFRKEKKELERPELLLGKGVDISAWNNHTPL